MDYSRRAVLAALAGGPLLMAFSADNPVVGGTSLARAQIQSPNFITGSTGWVIRQDGSAEFNNVVIRGGVVVGGTALYYSGTPALGNLVASIAGTAGTDSFGNAYLAGIVGYSSSGGIFYAAEMGPALGGSGVFGLWTASSAAGPYTFQGGLSADSSGNLTVGAAGNLTLNAVAGKLIGSLDASQFIGHLPVIQVDQNTHAVGNTAVAGDITGGWTVPAGDGVASTSYVIKALAIMQMGQTTAETLTIGADINSGTLVPLATLGAAFNGGILSATYDIPLELTLDVDCIGVNTPLIYLNGPIGNTSANRLATNSANMSGHSGTATWNKGNTNTLAIYAQWGGAGGSVQNIETVKSKFYREGP